MPPSYVKAGKKSLRYRNPLEKGIYWYWFAKVRVLEDFLEYGTCISCDKRVALDKLQGGHFVPAATGFAVLFEKLNVNGECEECNAFDQMHLRGYEKNLDLRYGAGTGQMLIDLKNQRQKEGIKEWKASDYEPKIRELIAHYQALVDNPQNHTTQGVE